MYQGNHLAHALRRGAGPAAQGVFAVAAAGGHVTRHAELWDMAERVAAVLVAEGVVSGDRVAVQVDKSVMALACYLGTVLAGAVHLPLNTAYHAAEVDYFLRDAGPRVFICDPDRQAVLAPVAQAAGVTQVLTLDAAGAGTLADAVRDAVPLRDAVPRGADDLAAILYTSGTTGRSKGAMLSHANLASNAAVLVDAWRFTAGDVLVHALPIFHTHGLFVAINVTLMAGSGIILHQTFDAAAVLADLGRATVLMGVPTFYTRLLDQTGLTPQAVAGMRLFVSGSAPMLTQTHHRWQDRTGHRVLERYGMTETNMNTSNPYEGVRKPGTVGLPLAGVDLRIVDDAGQAVGPDTPGGIEVRGPNLFRGYWQMPDKTAQDTTADGWFITGDLGTVDAEGYVTIVGRSKDVIITGGYNVYPKEVETVIDALDGVIESAVFGLSDPDAGEVVAVAVVLRDGGAITADDLAARIAPVLARYKQPRSWHVVEALPRNAMGKVQKTTLRQDFGPAGGGV